MKNNIYPKNYQSLLDLVETQKAIKLVKDTFERELAKELDPHYLWNQEPV